MIAGMAFVLATVLLWLAVVGICFLKGKSRLGWLLVLVTLLPVLVMAVVLADELWLSDPLDPSHDEAVEFGWSFLLAAWLLFGTATGFVALIAAAKPAKLDSWWATHHDRERPAAAGKRLMDDELEEADLFSD